ncbi:MAG: hypothetical protein ACQPRJ_02280 [Solitalea-like symbiont of Acarus siro]
MLQVIISFNRLILNLFNFLYRNSGIEISAAISLKEKYTKQEYEEIPNQNKDIWVVDKSTNLDYYVLKTKFIQAIN